MVPRNISPRSCAGCRNISCRYCWLAHAGTVEGPILQLQAQRQCVSFPVQIRTPGTIDSEGGTTTAVVSEAPNVGNSIPTLRTDGDLPVDDLVPHLPLSEVVRDLFTVVQIQPRKYMRRSCRLYKSHPATGARWYRSCRSICPERFRSWTVGIDHLAEVWNNGSYAPTPNPMGYYIRHSTKNIATPGRWRSTVDDLDRRQGCGKNKMDKMPLSTTFSGLV